ncbi:MULTISPECIES: hypothetical protein [unclassified Clostridium]|uniref:hypothetical protein n=1 Tax=unclassified Clostridium TaxID=2614128 RepID=UPI0025C4388D|nr:MULTISPECIES: hypothetical protein [unclassified Clostridium]
MEKYFSYEEMDRLIDNGEVEVIRRSQKPNGHGFRRHLVKYEGNKYLLCNSCDKYLNIDKFSDTKGTFTNKKHICKKCSCEKMVYTYENDFVSHLKYRYKSLESHSKKYDAPYLSFNEFIEFAKIVKDPIYNMTLEQAFYKNRFGDFEVEHKHPISKGGTSLVCNLILSYKPFNRLKGTMNVDEALKIAKLIVNHEKEIKSAYNA